MDLAIVRDDVQERLLMNEYADQLIDLRHARAGVIPQAIVAARAPSVSAADFSIEIADERTRRVLSEHLDRIGQDPEGGLILAAAKTHGVRFMVASSLSQDVAAQFKASDNAVTILEEKLNTAPDEFGVSAVATIVHELIHSITPENQSSKLEEGIASVIGARVESRMAGRPLLAHPFQVFNAFNKHPFYQWLPATNDITAVQRRLGLRTPGY